MIKLKEKDSLVNIFVKDKEKMVPIIRKNNRIHSLKCLVKKWEL
jgi:hypothetical protein